MSSSLTIESEDISTIAPYEYSGAGATSRELTIGENAYLSFIGTKDSRPQPLVFKSASGTRLVFKDPVLLDLGDGYSLCYIGNLQTISGEPQIVYKKVVDDTTDTIIYKPVEAIIDVVNDYSSNYALINMNTGKAYLLADPVTLEGLTSINIFETNTTSSVTATDNSIYIVAWTYPELSCVIYRIDKNRLEQESMVPMTNPKTIEFPQIVMVSDSVLVFEGQETGTSNYITMVRGTGPDSAPVRLERDKVLKHTIDGTTYDLPFQSFTMILDDNVIHCIYPCDKYMFYMDIEFVQDELRYGDVQAIEMEGITPSSPFWVDVIATESNATGMDAIIRMEPSSNTDQSVFLRISFSDDSLSYTKLNIESQYADSDAEYMLSGNRIYWLSGVGGKDQYLCYYELDSGNFKNFDLMGKSVANSRIKVLDDGTVLFCQYMAGTEIGTYSWNPDNETSPKLLMTEDVDVKQIISIDNL